MATEAAIPERKMSAFVIGYTGAVGRVLVRQLVDSRIYSRIVLIGRRQVEYSDEPLKQLVSCRSNLQLAKIYAVESSCGNVPLLSY